MTSSNHSVPFVTTSLDVLYRPISFATITLEAYHHHANGITITAFRLTPSVFAHFLYAASNAYNSSNNHEKRTELSTAIADVYDALCDSLPPEKAVRLHSLTDAQWDALRQAKPLPTPPPLPIVPDPKWGTVQKVGLDTTQTEIDRRIAQTSPCRVIDYPIVTVTAPAKSPKTNPASSPVSASPAKKPRTAARSPSPSPVTSSQTESLW